MRREVVTAILTASTLAGCGSGGPDLVPVSGTVTLEGKPIGGAHVTFAPKPGGDEGTHGGDITGASGYYNAMSGGRAGIAPGHYTVVVSLAAPGAGAQGEVADPYMVALSARARAADDPMARLAEVTGTFEREVLDDSNTFDFDLKLPPPPEPEPAAVPVRKGKRSAQGRRGP